jgi:hypothetical protein
MGIPIIRYDPTKLPPAIAGEPDCGAITSIVLIAFVASEPNDSCFPKAGKPAVKQSLETRIGDQGCAVSYYK